MQAGVYLKADIKDFTKELSAAFVFVQTRQGSFINPLWKTNKDIYITRIGVIGGRVFADSTQPKMKTWDCLASSSPPTASTTQASD